MGNDYGEKAQYNTSKIQQGINGLQKLVSQHSYKGFWGNAKEVVELFKTLKPLKKEDREQLWSVYSNICETAKQEMAVRKEEARSNASKLEQKIENIRYNYLDANAPFLTKRYYCREFWEHAKEISQMFKTNLLRKDREMLWSKYSNLCEEVKGQQKEEYSESKKSREIIMSLINSNYNQAEGSSNLEHLREARSMQSEILGIMKEKRLRREDRTYCWDWWKKVNKIISQKHQELGEKNFLYVKGEAGRCLDTSYYGDPYDVLKEIKETQSNIRELYMGREQRSEIRRILNDAWNRASSRISKMKEEKRRKHEEYLQKHSNWQERMEGNIQRWEGNIRKCQDYISSLESQISRLEDEEAGARTDEYANRVRGWITEKYQKIEEVRGSLSGLEEKIASVRGKMRR